MSETRMHILIIGYGNPGRQDDGLGPALAEAIERLALPGVTVDSDYQLTVEHAEMVARHDVVVFADATTDEHAPLEFNPVEPGAANVRFSSHHLAPADVLALARDLFDARPVGYVLAIRGHTFGQFAMGLSPEAEAHLAQAVGYLQDMIRNDCLCPQSCSTAKTPN